MKSTGIIRRIDDLGRIVIPKELRRTMGLADNAPVSPWLPVLWWAGGRPGNPRHQDLPQVRGGNAERVRHRFKNLRRKYI